MIMTRLKCSLAFLAASPSPKPGPTTAPASALCAGEPDITPPAGSHVGLRRPA